MNFSMSARLMLHLGEALISDELVALMELIKNSYDADSNYSKINIDTDVIDEYGEGYIDVFDNGSGMDLEIIECSFLKIATDYKVKHQKITPKYKRLSLGNKGLGRLALQRLGNLVKVVTKTNNGNAFEFIIDWRKFDQSDTEISDIEIEVIENEQANDIFHSGQGTSIRIYGLKNIGFWKEKQTIAKFEKEMFSIVNPYSNEDTQFDVYLNLDGESFSSDKYDVGYLEKLSDTIVDFDFSEAQKQLQISVFRNSKYTDYRYDSFKKTLSEHAEISRNDSENFYFDLKDYFQIDFSSNVSLQYSQIKNTNLLRMKDGQYYL
ncbi:MAG: ATP-binding protein, partial [Bacilli bacterium]|nr:ATP-binding protein [Bacilli bacterium]